MNALTEVDERETISTVDILVNQDTDQVRLARQLATIEIKSWLPSIKGNRTRPLDYLQDLLLGFEQSYLSLLEQLPEVRERVDAASAHNVRSVLRNTSIYGMFLMESTHPIYASSATRLHGLFAKLAIAVEFQPAFRGVLDDEVAQLMQFDVPAFYTCLKSPLVKGLLGNEMPFYGRSPLQAFQANLAVFSPQDCARQQSWIRRMLGRTSYPRSGLETSAGMEFVRALGNWLLSQAECVEGDGSISWLQIMLPEESGEVLPLPPTLYSGLAGMLFAYSAFAHELAEPAFDAACLRLRAMLRADVQRMIADGEDPSLFQGCAGVLYALLQDARLHSDPEQLEFVRVHARALSLHPLPTGAHDVISGRAGMMLFLCALLEDVEDPTLVKALEKLGIELMASRNSDLCSWSSEHGDCLGGFSHGNSGIAHALIRAGERLAREDFITLGSEALAFEDSRYNTEQANWPDLRKQTGAVFNASWCNGSVGYLISRSAHLKRLPEENVAFFKQAMQSLLQQTDFETDSLCHGSAGVLDILIDTHHRHPELVSATQLQDGLLRVLRAAPLRSGSRDCDAPGLMTGLAGIAYAVLRCCRPRLPSVLSVLH